MQYTMTWNNKEQCYIANVKTPDGKWIKKWLPKKLSRKEEIEAESTLVQWYQAKFFGTAIDQSKKPAKTLSLLGPKWLNYRFNDNTGTKINTYNGYKLSVNNWILDNNKFPHTKIDSFDIEKDLTVNDVRLWILSLKGARSSKLAHITALKSLLNDAQAEEWLDPEWVSPLDKKPIQKLIKEIARDRNHQGDITYLSPDQVSTLLTKTHHKVSDYRRIRYCIALSTGMRDHEIQGLIWSDLAFSDSIPFLNVQRQLDKIGSKDFRFYEKLTESGYTKDQVRRIPNALMSAPKYRSTRLIPLHPLALLALQWWQTTGWRLFTGKAPQPSDPIFPRGKTSLRGQSPGDFCFSEGAELLRQDLKRLGLPQDSQGRALTFHALRHTFSTLLDASSVEEARISVLLGHKGSKSTVRQNYIAKHLPTFAQDIHKLPLPPSLQLEHVCLSLSDARSCLPSSPREAPQVNSGSAPL